MNYLNSSPYVKITQIKITKFTIKNQEMDEMEEEINFSCDMCEKIYDTEKSLAKHRYRSHDQMPDEEKFDVYHCKYCKSLIFEENEINEHLQNSHFNEFMYDSILDLKKDIGTMKRDIRQLSRTMGDIHDRDVLAAIKKHFGKNFSKRMKIRTALDFMKLIKVMDKNGVCTPEMKNDFNIKFGVCLYGYLIYL